MDKKIILIMVSLLVIAAVVVAFVMIAAGGGLRAAGGFTKLYDKLEYTSWATSDDQYLQVPSDWDRGDVKKVSDVVVDMTYEKRTVSQTVVYITQLWFVYLGDKWSSPFESGGQEFFVPVTWGNGWLEVEHGLFHITVSSATNLSRECGIGEVITLESELDVNTNAMLAFGEWNPADFL